MNSISIKEDLQVGQLAIFIPYNHNTYIAATQHDQHRTIPNLHHQSHIYILDLNSYDNKTR